jgi:hypothetical protein
MIEILAPSSWQMTFGERAALEGILAQLRPAVAIEIGTAEGGSLQRIARYSRLVHSFDLVRPGGRAEELTNVVIHTGDSHVLLPEVLSELAAAGTNVDFVFVDGDHSTDGAERDLRDLLASDAIKRTVIVLHDTLNDAVREGLRRVDFTSEPKVVYADLDFIGGHLSHGGDFHHQLWGGLGLVVVDVAGFEAATEGDDGERFYDLFELLSPVRDALVTYEQRGRPAGPGQVNEAIGTSREDLQRARAEAASAQHWLNELQRSASWRVTAPLRAAKQRLGGRRT